MKPLVSIAMCTYNGQRFLKEQIQSILSQTYENFELVISDDASDDKTKEVVLAFDDPRVKWNQNIVRLGFIKNFESCLRLTTGDFIAFSDQDDVWKPNKIEVLMNYIGSASLVTSDLKAIDENGKVLTHSMKRNNALIEWFGNPDHRIALHYKLTATGNSSLFRRDLLTQSLPFPNGIEGHDWWLAHCAIRDRGIVYVDLPLTLYRRHGDNVSNFFNNTNIFTRILRYFSPKMLRSWFLERLRLRRLIVWSLNSSLSLNSKERLTLEQSSLFLNRLFSETLEFQDWRNAYLNKRFLYSKWWFFFLELVAYSALKVFNKQYLESFTASHAK